MSRKSPTTAMSVGYLRKQGYLVDVVERWIPRARIKRDLYGFIDLLAVPAQDAFTRPGLVPTLAVQTTTGAHLAERATKVREATYNFGTEEDPDERLILPMLLRSNWTVHVHGWVKRKQGRRSVWALRIWDMAADKEITESVHA